MDIIIANTGHTNIIEVKKTDIWNESNNENISNISVNCDLVNEKRNNRFIAFGSSMIQNETDNYVSMDIPVTTTDVDENRVESELISCVPLESGIFGKIERLYNTKMNGEENNTKFVVICIFIIIGDSVAQIWFVFDSKMIYKNEFGTMVFCGSNGNVNQWNH